MKLFVPEGKKHIFHLFLKNKKPPSKSQNFQFPCMFLKYFGCLVCIKKMEWDFFFFFLTHESFTYLRVAELFVSLRNRAIYIV